MKSTNLTAREYAVMKILWESDRPMRVAEILPLTKNISVNSMHPIMSRLLEKGFVKVVGNIKLVKAPSRLFEPAISISEYSMIKSAEVFSTNNKKFNLKEFLFYLMKRKKMDDEEIIKELEEFIGEYRKHNDTEG